MSIHVPALMEGDKIIIPKFQLGDVEYRTNSTGSAFSFQEYHEAMQLPTLAELRHAYFGGSDDYKQSVLSSRGRGEWTSTLLRNGVEAIEKPERISYDKKHNLWVAEGTPTKVELPPDGWTLEYDKPTGFPSKTSKKRSDAEKIFGDDTSYFYANRNGLRAVLRQFPLYGLGPFYVLADYAPDYRNSYFGGRASSRSEQDAKQIDDASHRQATGLATPDELTTEGRQYMMGQAEYDALAQLAEKNPEAADLLSKIRIQDKE